MVTHTPMPWRITRRGPDCNFDYTISAKYGAIAHVTDFGCDEQVNQYITLNREQAANARLILAAPELLVALKGMLSIYDRYTGVGLPEASVARALIAKIEKEDI